MSHLDRCSGLLVLTCCLSSTLAAQGKGGGGPKPPLDPSIAYLEPYKGAHALKVMNADGSNQRLVLGGLSGWTLPAMSPDGKEIAFGQTLSGRSGLHVIRSDGSGLRFVTPIARNADMVLPSWSPVPAPDGGSKIAFRDDDPVDGNWEVWIVNPDGSGRQQLTHTPPDLALGHYDWSRDATRMLAESVINSAALRIYGLALVGSQLAIVDESIVDLTGSPLQGASPSWLAWANTADVIALSAVTSDSSGNPDLWLISLPSPSQPFRLTRNSSADRYPTFAPDDSTLVYWNSAGIQVIRSDGAGNAVLSSKGLKPSRRRR